MANNYRIYNRLLGWKGNIQTYPERNRDRIFTEVDKPYIYINTLSSIPKDRDVFRAIGDCLNPVLAVGACYPDKSRTRLGQRLAITLSKMSLGINTKHLFCVYCRHQFS